MQTVPIHGSKETKFGNQVVNHGSILKQSLHVLRGLVPLKSCTLGSNETFCLLDKTPFERASSFKVVHSTLKQNLYERSSALKVMHSMLKQNLLPVGQNLYERASAFKVVHSMLKQNLLPFGQNMY